MTATLTAVTITSITSGPFSPVSTAVDAIAIFLLITLLIERELLRAFGGPRSLEWMRTFDIAIVPLLLMFGLTVVMRFAHLLHLV